MKEIISSSLTMLFLLSNAVSTVASEQRGAQAQNPRHDRSTKTVVFKAPPLPPKIGTPGQRLFSGGTRPLSCKLGNQSLTALVPAYSPQDGAVVWSATVSEQPTFWFYVPYTSSSAYGELVLEHPVTQQQTTHRVALAAKPGVIQVTLADTNVTLEIGKPYHWDFSVYCKTNPDDPDSEVHGNVTRQRIKGELLQQVDHAKLPQKVAAFAEHGIWHEALNIAAALHCARPENSAWTQLLQAIGLQQLAQEPIALCHSPAQPARQP